MRAQASTSASPKRRAGSLYGWWLVAASVLANGLTSAAYFQGFQAFFLPILDTFGWSRTAISGAFSFRQLESGIMAPVAGFMMNRVGPRKLIIGGAVIAGLSLIGLSQTRDLLTFYLFFALISVGTTGISHGITWPVVIARWFRRRVGFALGVATIGPLVGSLFVLPNVWLVDAFGWRPIVFAYGVAVLVGVMALGFTVRDRPPREFIQGTNGAAKAGTQDAPASSRTLPEDEGLSLGQAVRTREFWVFSLYLSGTFLSISGFHAHQLPYFESVGLSTTAAANTVVLVFVASGAGRMVAGALTDLVDYRLILGVIALSVAGSFLYLATMPGGTLATAVPFTLLFGVSFGSTVPMRAVVTRLLFGTRAMGPIIGLLWASAVTGGVVGPLIMGTVFDATGSYALSIWIMAGVTVFSTPLVLFMRSPRTLSLQHAGPAS